MHLEPGPIDFISVNTIGAEEMSTYGHNPECAPPEGWGREEESERPVQEVGKYAEESRDEKEEVDPGLDNKRVLVFAIGVS